VELEPHHEAVQQSVISEVVFMEHETIETLKYGVDAFLF
jgi:hypothetical protein